MSIEEAVVADAPASVTTDLAEQIDDLWSAEMCDWKLNHETGDLPWVAILEWTSEHGNPHDCDWVTYTWQVYGDTPEDALTEAVQWLDALAEWQRLTCKHEDTYEVLDEGRANDAGISQRHQCWTCGEIV